MKINDLQIDDSVKVKDGMLCPDLEGLCIGGWQGRISAIAEADDGSDLIFIEWDSITIENMPDYFIEQSIDECLEYSSMYLAPEDVELTKSRDKKEDVAKAQGSSFKTRRWGCSGEDGNGIQKVINGDN